MRKAVGKWFYFILFCLCAAAMILMAWSGNRSSENVSFAVGENAVLSSANEGQKLLVDLNTADADTLKLLPDITSGMAEEIIEYREIFGRFWSTEDLMDIDGITIETYDKIKDMVTVGG